MAVPFSNTTLRVPLGFRNLLEGFTREVLRNQPEDIFIFGARYFSLLLTARKENNDDPCKVGGNHEDRFYNAKMWKTDDIATMCSKTLNDAAQMIQREYKAMTSARLANLLSQNASAVEIQRVFRGHKEREYQKTSAEEEMEEELDDGFVIVLEDAEKEMSDAAESLTAAFEGMIERGSSPDIPEEYEEEEAEMTTTLDEQVTSLENLDQEQRDRDPTQGSIVN